MSEVTSLIRGEHDSSPPRSRGCSTFMLSRGQELVVGHNLDLPRRLPGMIVINKRSVSKTSSSWHELLTSEEPVSQRMSWVSKYGSVTFNPIGREFPDGGINEAGLSIHEMTLSETEYPENDTAPCMFMAHWVQYVLDSFESVEQVLGSASQIVLDGWGWHFFVSDREGGCAIIEFLDGKPVIYSGQSVPVHALCNTQYAHEIEQLKGYEGFGGDQDIDLGDKNFPRFVHAAHMLGNLDAVASASLVDYGFDILRTVERGITQWSYVIDVPQLEVHFRTSVAEKIKHLDLGAFDFSCETPPEVLDIDYPISAEVSAHFVAYTPEINRQFITKGFECVATSPDFEELIGSRCDSVEQLIHRMATYPDFTICG
jgi:penicillin V acylase-like amidase (Ntn superfamily)